MCGQICHLINMLKETLSHLQLDQAKTEQFSPDNTLHDLSIDIYFMMILLQQHFNNFVSKGHLPGPTVLYP